MAENRLEFLEDEVGAETPKEDTESTEVVEEVESTEEAPAPSDKGETAAPPAAVEKEPNLAPIQALLDEREKRQAREREALQARQQLAELQRAMAEKEREAQQAPPDFFANPDERVQFELQRYHQQAQARQEQQRLSMSRFYAEKEFGKESVEDAFEYFNQHPQLSSQLLNHPSPFHAAVEFVKKQRIADEVGTDPDAYRKRLLDELAPQLREQIKAELMAEMAPAKATIPGSLASAPSARGPEPATHRTTGNLQGFFSS